MEEKACCVTGHRDIPADKVAYVKEKLLGEIEAAIADGYTTFRSGFAEGANLLFAALVLKLKEEKPPPAFRSRNSVQNPPEFKKPSAVRMLCGLRPYSHPAG